jgi:hypothetical protein
MHELVVGTESLACPQNPVARFGAVRIKRSTLTHRSIMVAPDDRRHIRPKAPPLINSRLVRMLG